MKRTLACLCTLLAVTSVPAQELNVSIEAINKAERKLTTYVRLQKASRVYTLKPDVQITDPLNTPLKLEDLKVHDRLAVTVKGGDLSAIRLERNLDWGVVKENDPDAKQLTLIQGPHGRSIKWDPKVKVMIDGQTASFADLLPKMVVRLLLDSSRQRLEQVWADSKYGYSANPYIIPKYLRGYIEQLDLAKKTVRFTTSDRYRTFDLPLDPWANVQYVLNTNQKVSSQLPSASATSIKAPFRGMVLIEPDTRKVIHFHFEVPVSARRQVQKLDVDKRIITVAADSDDPQETFTIAPDARILKDDKPTFLDEIRVGSYVFLGLNAEQKEVLYLNGYAK